MRRGLPRIRVVAAFDFGEPARAALAEAVRFARVTHAELVILHVFPDGVAPGEFGWKGGETQREQECATLCALLEREAADARSLQVSARVRTAHGDTATRILAAAADEQASAIFVGADRHDGIRGALLGRTATRVVRESDVPVFVVRRYAAPSPTDTLAGRRIVVGTDFTSPSIAALESAAALAAAEGGELRIVHVAPAARPYDADELLCLRRRLEGIAGEMAARGIRASASLAYGDAATALVAETEDDPSAVIAVGTRWRSRVARTLAGSVAESVMRLSDATVLVAHSGADARPLVAQPALRGGRRRPRVHR